MMIPLISIGGHMGGPRWRESTLGKSTGGLIYQDKAVCRRAKISVARRSLSDLAPRWRFLIGAIVIAAASASSAITFPRVDIKVQNAAGEAVPNANVNVTTPNSAKYRLTAKTNARGQCSALLVDPDWDYLIRAEKPGLAPGQTAVHLSAGATERVTLTLYAVSAAAPAVPSAQDPDALFAAGMKAYDAGDFHTSGMYFIQASQIRRDFSRAYFYLAMSEYMLGRYEESRATFERFLELSPKGPDADAARKLLGMMPKR